MGLACKKPTLVYLLMVMDYVSFFLKSVRINYLFEIMSFLTFGHTLCTYSREFDCGVSLNSKILTDLRKKDQNKGTFLPN